MFNFATNKQTDIKKETEMFSSRRLAMNKIKEHKTMLSGDGTDGAGTRAGLL